MGERYEVVVIGTGFGGAISACRTSKAWPGKVLVLERGKRYPMGSFPRKPHDLARNFWNLPDENRGRFKELEGEELHGLFDMRSYRHMDAVVGAGLGGGSLIYANVFLEPPDKVFEEGWPESCTSSSLQPYYSIAKEVLGARPIPRNGDPRRRVVRNDLYKEFAERTGRKSEDVDINVFFGNDFANPTPIGYQEPNRYGAIQTSCVYCGECDVGCNTHSKNTLDLNYLYVAEQRYGAEIRTEHLVEKISPVNARGEDDPGADGSNGYRVVFRDLNERTEQSVLSNRVVVSAGSLGSTELLMRCKHRGSLPRISDALGRRFSANGDFLSFVIAGNKPADPNYGPVITQKIDFNLYEDFDRSKAFVLEDASYPSFAAWFIEGVKPGFLRLGPLWRGLRHVMNRVLRGDSPGTVGIAFSELLRGDLSYNSSVLLCMGLDRSNGTLFLDSSGNVDLDWPYKGSMSLYKAIENAGRQFKEVFGAKKFLPLPTWLPPLRKNVCVHALGGCALADNQADGVTSGDPANFGQVFGYSGLYVADGAILPTAVGANPAATISALSERVARGITGIEPSADL